MERNVGDNCEQCLKTQKQDSLSKRGGG